MTTLAEVAKHAKVSPSQVSFVVNGKNLHMVSAQRRKRIQHWIDKLGYRPNVAARQLTGKRAQVLGVIMHTRVAQVNIGRLAAIEAEANRRGYRIMISSIVNRTEDIKRTVAELSAHHLDGLICIAHYYPDDPAALPRALARERHVVYLKKPAAGSAPYVDLDFASASRKSVVHLARRGRRRVALCLPAAPYGVIDERIRGYREAIEREGLASDEALIDQVTVPDNEYLAADAAHGVVERLVEGAKADAIIAFNDFWGARLLQALQGQGRRVPEDVAVIGFNNLQLSDLLTPPLTSVDERDDEVARHLVRLLVDRIEGQDTDDEPIVVEPRLVVRNST